MKKFKKLLLVLIVFAMLPIGVFAKEKVNVYLFKREGCGYCANALTFFGSLSEDSEYQNYFDFVVKDVSNKENNTLMEKAAKKLGVTLQGVPFIVIGEEHFEGYSNIYDEEIKKAIKNAYENESKDIVFNNVEEDSSAVTIFILLGVIFGIAFLIYMARDNNKEEKVEEESLNVEKKKTMEPRKKSKTTTVTKSKRTTTKSKKSNNKK